jgi:phosphonate transport system substrate-binding protein
VTPPEGAGRRRSSLRLTAVAAVAPPTPETEHRTMVRRLALLCCALALLAAACGTGGPDTAGTDTGTPDTDTDTDTDTAEDPDVLRVGLIPNVSPDEQRARYEPFGEHLASVLGIEVELFVASSYAGVVTALASDRLDIAYLGGVTYVQAEQQVALDPLVTEVDRLTGTSQYESAIVVRDDSDLETLDDVLAAGGVFAMGDVASTSGSLYPRIMLVEAGADCSAQRLESCEPLEQVVFTGGHDAAAQAVLQGGADAGGLELRILRRLEREGVVDEGALRVIQTIDVEGYPWVAREALPQGLRDRIVDAFLAIEDPDLLDLLRADGYVAVTAEDYDEIRTEAARLGLLEEG